MIPHAEDYQENRQDMWHRIVEAAAASLSRQATGGQRRSRRWTSWPCRTARSHNASSKGYMGLADAIKQHSMVGVAQAGVAGPLSLPGFAMPAAQAAGAQLRPSQNIAWCGWS